MAGAAASGLLAAGRANAQAESRRYKACIIGDTAHGGYGHSQHMDFALRPDVAVVGLADPDEAGRRKHAKECGAERTYADYAEMLDKERPDLVVIAPRWTVRHREYLLACADIGAHGFIEKPLCVDLDEADAMVAAVEAKKLKWAIAFNMRATPTLEHVKKLVIKEGLIGRLLEMRGRGKEDHRSGGEDLVVLGPHVFDLMAWLMQGLPQWCVSDVLREGKAAEPEDVHEATEQLGPVMGDTLHAMFGFTGGVTGYFASVKDADKAASRFGLDLYGTRGIVTIRLGAIPGVAWLDSPLWTGNAPDTAWKPLPDAPAYTIKDAARETFKPIVDDLIAAIEADRAPAVSLADGRRSLEMVQAIFESHVQGGRVAVPLVQRSHPLKRWGAR
jgi:predicted dehydrogenase